MSPALPDISNAAQEQLRRMGVNADLSTLYRPDSFTSQAQTIATSLAQNMVSFATGLASFSFSVLIIFILSFYFTVDGPRIAILCVRAAQEICVRRWHHLSIASSKALGDS